MGRNENIEVFKDTEKLVKNNEKIKASVKTSTDKQKLILEDDTIDLGRKEKKRDPARVIVSQKRTFEAASEYKDMKTAVHNFASATNPGGGVVRGAGAQEECLCRCSGLYFNLNEQDMWDGFYRPHCASRNPLHNADIIFTPDVLVFKTDTENPKLLSEDDWYKVDVITCAAPNLRDKPSSMFHQSDDVKNNKISDKELLLIHEKRLRRILDIAVAEGDEVIILGAFGCGAFSNNPEVVALAAKNVIKEYLNTFDVIEFAVYCGPKDNRNFKIFERVLKVYEK